MNIAGTGKSSGSWSSRPHGINVNSSIYNKCVRLLCGLVQSSIDLVWYNDWKAHDNPVNSALASITNQTGSKKAGKGGIKFYSAAVDLLIGHAPILGIMTAWMNNVKLNVQKNSVSGIIQNGQFTFTPASGKVAKIVIEGLVPLTPPYTFQAPNFVADVRVRIDFGPGGYDNAYLTRSDPALPPGPMQYTVTSSGLYTFNVAQAGDSLRITYFAAQTGGTPAPLVAIYAVTLHEDFNFTFNDYGGPGAVTQYGTWERPLWNAAFSVPGNYTTPNSGRLRDPYTWWYTPPNPTVNFPPALEGLACTVYYGIPVIFKSDGTFYSSQRTPLDILNLEFERSLGNGTEYTNHPEQQIIQSWVSGVGSTELDLGSVNAIPNFNFECISAFTQWPNGDCDIVDIITDVAYSGPIIVDTGY